MVRGPPSGRSARSATDVTIGLDYLEEVARHLPFVDSVKRDVMTELADYVEDATEDLVDAGSTPHDALTEVLRRLGRPEQLASSLTRAHQTNRRLLAAAGGGTLAALGGAARGIAVGIVVSIAMFICMMVMRLALGEAVSDALVWASNHTLVLFGLFVLLYSMGRVTPRPVAAISARCSDSLRASRCPRV